MRNNLDHTLAAMSPHHVSGYLRERGWIDAGQFGPFGRIFSATQENGVTAEIVLPTRRSARDFTRRMSELVDDLTKFEDRPAAAIISDLALSAFDVLRVRSRDADDYGSIKFSEGLHLHEEAQSLVVAAARAAHSNVARRAWRGRRPDAVTEYLDHIRLGQTERRSFSLTILSPYSFEPGPQHSFLEENAFGRRVTETLGGALNAIEDALSDSVANDIAAFEKTVPFGVSADMCQSLAKLATEGDTGIEVSVTWSPAKPAGSPSSSISVSRQDAALLTEVARVFSAQEPEPQTWLEGPIRVIAEEPNAFDGSAVIDALVGGRIRRVRVNFTHEMRHKVFAAAVEKKWVRVRGEVTREGKALQLARPDAVDVIDPQDD